VIADLTSPNHVEALSLCSISSSSLEAIEAACMMLAELRPKEAVVIRAGAMGACYALSSSPKSVHWVPAYWTESEVHQVVDVTGAGNGFLGGLCAGLDEGKDVREGESDSLWAELMVAVVWGSVAASFIVQQVGLPVLTTSEDGSETWNGAGVRERVDNLVAECSKRS